MIEYPIMEQFLLSPEPCIIVLTFKSYLIIKLSNLQDLFN